MTEKETTAVNVLVQTAELAQKNGLLSLSDASLVHHAVQILNQLKEEPEVLAEPIQSPYVGPITSESETNPTMSKEIEGYK